MCAQLRIRASINLMVGRMKTDIQINTKRYEWLIFKNMVLVLKGRIQFRVTILYSCKINAKNRIQNVV